MLSLKKKPSTEQAENVTISQPKPGEISYQSLQDVPKDLTGLSVGEVSDCLCLLHLGHLAPTFVDRQIDGSLLKTLRMGTLRKDLDITELESTKLEKFVHDGWRPNLDRPPSPEQQQEDDSDNTRL